ncbi:MAG TPA: TMEM175 family protein [Thermoplasmata archaeon]|nr:TMEM175 family protein [Thermoplasmata archaeon]
MDDEIAGRPADDRSALPFNDRLPPGEDLTRIISLSDGVFAFSLTFLVISLVVPTGLTEGQLGAHLAQDWPTFLGYAFAFFLIANWWTIHHRTFSYVRRYDGTVVWINMSILLEIAVMPFVLTVFTTYGVAGDQYAVILFAATQALTGVTFAGLWRYATADHRLVDPDLDARLIRYYADRGLVTPLIFVLSIAISFASVSWAEYSWVAMFVVPRLLRRYRFS